MTGLQIQERLGKIVTDLQTTRKGFETGIGLRGANGALQVFPLSSDANGDVNNAQRNAIEAVLTDVMAAADGFEQQYAPVKAASESLRTALGAHTQMIEAARQARQDLTDALEVDAAYQTAKTDYDTARSDPAYIVAREDYKNLNVSENYNNLQDARGKYVAV